MSAIELYDADDATRRLPALLAIDLKRMGVNAPAETPTLVSHFDRQEESKIASETFRRLMERVVPTSPEHVARFLFEAVARFRNSYVWAGGVPDMKSGRIVDVCRDAEWFSFLDKPFSNHIPLARRIDMAKFYLGRIMELHIANADFWQGLLASLPRSCAGGPLLQTLGSL